MMMIVFKLVRGRQLEWHTNDDDDDNGGSGSDDDNDDEVHRGSEPLFESCQNYCMPNHAWPCFALSLTSPLPHLDSPSFSIILLLLALSLFSPYFPASFSHFS